MKVREKMQLLYDTNFVQDLLNKIKELEEAVNAKGPTPVSEHYYLNQLALLDDELKEKNNRINDLEQDLEVAIQRCELKDNEINELELALSRTEFQVADLEEEIEEKYNRINELAEALETIREAVRSV